MNEGTDLLAPWQPASIEIGQTLHWHIGPLKLWIQKGEREWLLTTQQVPEDEQSMVAAEPQDAPEEVEWRRWAGGDRQGVVQLVPVTPDRSVVVRPRHPLAFPPEAGGTFYARIPVWVRVTVGPDGAVTLCELPTLTLSNTWFGPDTTEGQLCYAMKTTAPGDRSEVTMVPHRVVCTLRLHNGADGPLDFQRLCVRCEHLSIYGADGAMWSSEVAVTYRGEGGQSKVRCVEEPFEKRDDVSLLSPPRTPASGSLLARSFAGFVRLGNLL